MMKKIVNLSLALILMFGTMVWAQSGRGNRGGDPTERAERLTASMTELLNLDDSQQDQVGDLNLEYAMKMQENRKEIQGDREAMREMMVALNQEKEEKLSAILSEEQMQLYHEKKEEFRKNSRERRDKRRARRESASE
ncbi:Spy/CpxP family protein refolding chaperone [Tunicatimonas pelagia]|uniref:Spy/CpxP family protein refolding chaperone n=1 Tax=Tunicatimonas pelagia TaxID=931531 RepID=UPI002665EBDA|nr:periplasmic heavy metal sensor [Tunicatimonas pelagia]WKN46131.1 periplasmic heavy metal sensor [Tunicatimonas pelagia]